MNKDDEIPQGINDSKLLEHVGYESQRVVFASSGMDLLERVLAFRWMERNNDTWCILDRLVCTDDNPRGATQRDAEVAATVIQWLGTAVGYSFMRSCLEEAGFKIQSPR